MIWVRGGVNEGKREFGIRRETAVCQGIGDVQDNPAASSSCVAGGVRDPNWPLMVAKRAKNEF